MASSDTTNNGAFTTFMAIEAGPDVGEPVHEMLTLAALINSDYKLDPTIRYKALRDHPSAHPDVNDFIRGVMWNDDPEDELFNDNPVSNFEYSSGFVWWTKFQTGGFSKPELIHRSHFGDLQWLHAMAIGGDWPADTKSRIMQWMETMYDVSIGAMSPDTALSSTKVGSWFNDPAHYNTIGELLTHRHRGPVVVSHRALGSCFHVIQDSYAVGHTWREKLNPNRGPGEPARWGAILNFHSYPGQDDTKHKHFDHSKDSLNQIDLANPDSWNGLLGCRDGLDNCIHLANLWHRKAAWDEVSAWLDGSVFVVSPNATRSDNKIREKS